MPNDPRPISFPMRMSSGLMCQKFFSVSRDGFFFRDANGAGAPLIAASTERLLRE